MTLMCGTWKLNGLRTAICSHYAQRQAEKEKSKVLIIRNISLRIIAYHMQRANGVVCNLRSGHETEIWK